MRLLLYAVMALVAVSCSYSGSCFIDGLDEAQQLMQSDPRAAFDRLNECDVTEFRDSATMARWALLYGEAMAANRFYAPTDTIIDIALVYYRNHNMAEQERRARELKSLISSGDGRDALVTALYLQKEKEFMLYKERSMRRQYSLAGLALLLMSACVMSWQRQRLKLRRVQAGVLMGEVSDLQRECSQLVSKLESGLSGRFSVLNGLCETYYESQGFGIERKAIVRKVRQQIESMQADAGLFAEMERAVNECRDGMLMLLRGEMPALKPCDYRMMVYLACGLSNRSMALLLDESIEVIYKRKSRLKARIAGCGPAHAELFLSVF